MNVGILLVKVERVVMLLLLVGRRRNRSRSRRRRRLERVVLLLLLLLLLLGRSRNRSLRRLLERVILLLLGRRNTNPTHHLIPPIWGVHCGVLLSILAHRILLLVMLRHWLLKPAAAATNI